MAWVQAASSPVAHWYTSEDHAVCDRHPIPPGNGRKMVGSRFCPICQAMKAALTAP